MTTPRNRLINLEATTYYHCTCRCVRRAFLTGIDHYSGRSFQHRRSWIEQRLFALSQVFSIEICSYAIMDDHYHVVLCVDKVQPIRWTFAEIFTRWTKIFKGDELARAYLSGKNFDEGELLRVAKLAAEYRRRLMSISWFMKEVNESVARRANKEDGVSGRFWESRFRSQALLDEAAVLSCMVYVDLNPIRAGISEKPEDSEFTSIRTRVRQLLGQGEGNSRILKPFIDGSLSDDCQLGTSEGPVALNIQLEHYLELVDWSGKVVRKDKFGSIPEHIPPILFRIGLDQDEWYMRTKYFSRRFCCVAGAWESIVLAAKKFGRHWFHGKGTKKVKT